MKYGFIKVCSATPQIRVADVQFNSENIVQNVLAAAEKGCQLIVFPELCLCGYTCGDLFQQTVLLNSVVDGLRDICAKTAHVKTLIFVGAPLKHKGKIYNCAVAINCGSIIGVVPKSFVPNYGEFYEKRHFVPAGKQIDEIQIAGCKAPFGTDILFQCEEYDKFTVSAEICEDLWMPDSPSVRHAMAGANIIVNLSCSDEIVGKEQYRRDLVKIQSGKLVCGYIYADAGEGESTTDMVFAGHNLICENGALLAESKLFCNGTVYADLDVDKLDGERRRMASSYFQTAENQHIFVSFKTNNDCGELEREFSKMPFVPSDNAQLSERAETILTIQAKGLEKRLKHTSAKTAVVGVSGGLDSALAFLVACRAFDSLGLDKKNIVAVTMPGFGTTGKTLGNSLSLIENMGATCKKIPIGDSVLQHFKDIEHDPAMHDVTYENAQARMRTMILMDIANKTGGMVIGTGDLSELALGWATYNGDHMSMYAVNSSVPKTLVKYLIGYEAERLGGECKKILTEILNTEISPELLPPDDNGAISQKTEDIVGPYILHDFFLYYAVRWGFEPSKIKFLAEKTFAEDFDRKTIEKWLKNFYKRFFSQQFKRSCMPDGVKVGSVSLSPRGDWRMPSDAIVDSWLKNLN